MAFDENRICSYTFRVVYLLNSNSDTECGLLSILSIFILLPENRGLSSQFKRKSG